MDAYSPEDGPPAVGLANVGSICYFNALLQTLVSCTAFTRAAESSSALLATTRTGLAMLAYLRSLRLPSSGPPGSDPTQGSSHILSALVADLAERRPWVRFGTGQESASEALCHLLDMLEPPPLGAQSSQGQLSATNTSSITDLFVHRSTCDVYCLSCRRRVSRMRDHAVHISLFHVDGLAAPRTSEEFALAASRQISEVEDYACSACGHKGRALRLYTLTMVPEILYCLFNLYGGRERTRWFPERLSLPGKNPGVFLQYRLVGQIEHSGSLQGGHYWARCLRAGQVYAMNDANVAPSSFSPTASTYIVVYHYELTRTGPADEWKTLSRARAPPA